MFAILETIFTLLFWAWIILLIMRIHSKKHNPSKYPERRKWSNRLLISFIVVFIITIPFGIMDGQANDSSSNDNSLSINAYNQAGKKAEKMDGNTWSLDTNKSDQDVITVKLSQNSNFKYKISDSDKDKLKKFEKVSGKEYKFYIDMPHSSNDGKGSLDIYITAKNGKNVVKRDYYINSYELAKSIDKSANSSSSEESNESSSSSSSHKNHSASKSAISFNDAISSLPNKLSGEVDKAKWDKSESEVTIVLDDKVVTETSDSDLKKICYELWNGVKGIAQNANEQYASYINIEDNNGNTIAETSMFGHFKYKGLGN